jgi:Sec-independent protein translocase protein TatA
MSGIGLPELIILGVVGLLVTAVPIVLVMICVAWMRSTRASQRRVDEQNASIIELLEKQTALLERIANRATDRQSSS